MQGDLIIATAPAQSLEKALRLLRVAIADDGQSTLAGLALAASLPVSTAHRFALSLQRGGYLIRVPSGRYLPGAVLLGMQENISHGRQLAQTCRPALRRLAASCRQTAHLGILQDDMVTYLIKESATAQTIFTQEGMQLEAYCSAIGRVLLAFQPAAARDAYLSGGPFVPLTGRTLTARAALDAELNRVRAAGYAIEVGEVAEDICCIAAPVRSPDGVVRAAISVACPHARFSPGFRDATLAMLHVATAAAARHAYGDAQTPSPD